jgi:hypothetical protein
MQQRYVLDAITLTSQSRPFYFMYQCMCYPFFPVGNRSTVKKIFFNGAHLVSWSKSLWPGWEHVVVVHYIISLWYITHVHFYLFNKLLKTKTTICLTSTDVCVKNGGGVKSKLVVARGSTDPQWTGCRFWCGVLVWVYCLTCSDVESWYGYTVLHVLMWSPGMGILSYFLLFTMFMNWVSGDCYLYILDYYRRVIQKCRSRRSRDRMVVGLTTTCAITAYYF